MRTFRGLEKQLATLETEIDKSSLRMTLDDGRNVKINCGDPDGILSFLEAAVKNENHPFKKYVMHAVEGHSDEGKIVMTCKAIWESHARIAAGL